MDREDEIIRATLEAHITKDDLVQMFEQNGLLGVFNLGMATMLNYKEKQNEKSISSC